jgi:hypothetical protein
MPEQEPEVNGAETESSPASASSIEEAWEQARQSAESQTETPVSSSGTDSVPAESGKAEQEEPEHIRWVKSVSGNLAPDGSVNVDAVTRQAYELHRQTQLQAQQIAQIRQMFNDPRIADAIRRAVAPPQAAGDAASRETPAAEKTDEELFNELIERRVEEKLRQLSPAVDRTSWLYQQQLATVKSGALNQLVSEFGPDSEVPFSEIEPLLVVRLQQAAAANGTDPTNLLNVLAETGKLYDTLALQARDIAFQLLRAKRKQQASGGGNGVAPQPGQSVAQPQLRANLSRPGSPSHSVRPAEREIRDIEDAWQAAKEELAARR